MQKQSISSSTKKAIIITTIIIAAMAIATILTVLLITNKTSTEGQGQTQQDNVFEKSYSEAMKLYKELNDKEIPVDELENEAKKLNINITVRQSKDTGTILLKDTNETINFQIIKEDDSSNTAIDFVYHENISGKDTFVLQSGEKTFQHFNGTATNEFKSIEEALNDHLLIRK